MRFTSTFRGQKWPATILHGTKRENWADIHIHFDHGKKSTSEAVAQVLALSNPPTPERGFARSKANGQHWEEGKRRQGPSDLAGGSSLLQS